MNRFIKNNVYINYLIYSALLSVSYSTDSKELKTILQTKMLNNKAYKTKQYQISSTNICIAFKRFYFNFLHNFF